MKKRISLIVAIAFFTMLNGCNVLKNKNRTKSKLDETTSISTASNSLKVDSSILKNSIITTGKETTYSEETTITNPGYQPKDIEISANFKVDTSAIISGDTVLKLIDIKNGNTSLTIYQNRKTKQLMAKVKSPEGTQRTEFSQISLKRTLNTKNSKQVDSSTNQKAIKESEAVTSAVKVDKSLVEKSISKDKATTINYEMWALIGIGLVVLAYLVYRWIRK